MLLSFELSMPNKGSWNGQWSGAAKRYVIVRKVPNPQCDVIMNDAKSEPIYEGFIARTKVGETQPRKSYYYNFGDGWGASIRVEEVTSKQAAGLRKLSDGFCGYDWMVDSIIKHNEILSTKQVKEKQEVADVK